MAVESGRAKPGVRIHATGEIQPHLPQAEEIKVVDEERSDEDDEPAECGKTLDGNSSDRVFDIPYHSAHGLPEPEEQNKSHA